MMILYSYKKLEDLENHLSTLETASAKYDPYGFEKATMNSLKELISVFLQCSFIVLLPWEHPFGCSLLFLLCR